jgi:hypothetical protein
MKLNTSTGGAFETANLTETRDFTIRASGKAFKILIDGLYADKVAAVIRELCTNAYDAHLAIGKGDVPFVVRLPTIFDPTFKVRDFGVSMTHEQTMRLLSTVFESSKDTSNNQVGAFGLGSKSPFSLVDSFTITVWKDGERRVYTAYFAKDGVPSIALMDRQPSTEPQGVEFQMTIEQKDVTGFRDKAASILQWFPTFPKIEGNQITLMKPVTLASGKGWQLLQSHGGARARQGCVVYPLSASSISQLPPEYVALLNAPLLIDFPIGSLDVAASRESLSYDAPTCANIVARLNSVSKDVHEHYGKSIKDAPTLWEAGKKLRELSQKSNLPISLVRLIAGTKWKGTTNCDNFSMSRIITDLDAKGIKFSPYFWEYYRLRRLNSSVYIDGDSRSSGSRMLWDYGNETLSIYFTVAEKRPTHEGRRIMEHYKRVANNGSAILFVLADEADHKAILDAMGNPPATMVTWTRDLPAPVMTPRASAPKRGTTKKEEVKVREAKLGKDGYALEPEKVVQLDGDAYYVFMRESIIQDLGPRKIKAQISTFLNGLHGLHAAGFVDSTKPLYVVSVVYQKRVEDSGSWTEWSATLAPHVTTLEDKLTVEGENQSLANMLRGDNWCTLLRVNQTLVGVVQNSKRGNLYDIHSAIPNLGIENTEKWLNALAAPYARTLVAFNDLGYDVSNVRSKAQSRVNNSPKLATLISKIQACNRSYPILRKYDHYTLTRGSSADLAPILEYIEAIDLLHATRAAAKTAAIVQTTAASSTTIAA